MAILALPDRKAAIVRHGINLEIKKNNMSVNKEKRIKIAQETLQILEQGRYRNQSGEIIAVDTRFALENTVHYDGGQLDKLHAALALKKTFATRVEVNNETTLSAARRLVAQGHAHPLCLNFASARNPGGGFLGGAEAQEENLAKSSGLYPCLLQAPAYYAGNRAQRSCMYNDDMVYSPRVPVFRNDGYALLDSAYEVAVLTAPAANRGAVAMHEPERLGEIEAVMLRRIDLLLSVAAAHGHTTLVLGAWGCGVFRNKPEEMAQWFAVHLLRGERYRGVFDLVSFAVYDRKGDGTFAAFEKVIGSAAK